MKLSTTISFKKEENDKNLKFPIILLSTKEKKTSSNSF